MSSTVSTSTIDLPPRTWPQWWRELPGYWRIGTWAALVVSVLNIGIAARMAFGLIESLRTTALRNRGAMIYYFWHDENSAPPRTDDWQQASIYGRSRRNVTALILTDVRNFQAVELPGLLSDYPNLKFLNLAGLPITVKDLEAVKNCRRLRMLALADTDVDDGIAEIANQLPDLEELYLQGTLVTDELIPRLAEHPELKGIVIMGTVAAETDSQLPHRFKTRYGQANWVWASTRWADGRFAWSHRELFTLSHEGPLASPGVKPTRTISPLIGNVPNLQTGSLTDGEYRLILEIGEVQSEPVIVTVVSGQTETPHIQFRMPVTKDEALRSLSLSERGASGP
jgi:hypothetical protein